jgi:hypothetical protein
MYTGPNIITNGLVLSLDAANIKSYVSGSTTWRDLSGNNNSGSLVNGPTFSSANGGSIVFDGSNNYNQQILPYYPTFTIFIWVYPISGQGLMLYGNSSTFPILLLDYNILGNLRIYAKDYYETFASVLTINSWNLITVTANQTLSTRGVFINGILKGSNGYTVDSQTGLFRLGVQNFLGYGNCRIAQTLFYNRALTSSEVSQNYNATKGRFGL